VRAFAFPYGLAADATAAAVSAVAGSGHDAAFLVHGRHNQAGSDRHRLCRVSVQGRTDSASFAEVEVLPRLRRLRRATATP
jgi:hypothetical protein